MNKINDPLYFLFGWSRWFGMYFDSFNTSSGRCVLKIIWKLVTWLSKLSFKLKINQGMIQSFYELNIGKRDVAVCFLYTLLSLALSYKSWKSAIIYMTVIKYKQIILNINLDDVTWYESILMLWRVRCYRYGEVALAFKWNFSHLIV